MGLKASMAVAMTLLVISGCAARLDASGVTMPTPSPGDIEGQIMSVTGAGFTICGVGGGDAYQVEVCGDSVKAQAALSDQLPGVCGCTFTAYSPDDGGSHTPKQLVMQFWVDRTTGSGFQVTSSQILGNGKIDVGVDGDLNAAEAVLNREFPGFIEVHHQDVVQPM